MFVRKSDAGLPQRRAQSVTKATLARRPFPRVHLVAARGNRFIRECFAIGKEIFGKLDWPCEMSFTGKGHAHLVIVAPAGKYRLKVVCTPADNDDAKVYFRQSCERLVRTALAGKAWGQDIPTPPPES